MSASGLVLFREARNQGMSERQFEQESGISRSTARHWNKRAMGSGMLPEGVRAAFESPQGVAWLARLVVSIQFVVTLRAPGGIRLVCEILKLSGLSELVASSFGSVQAMSLEMQREIVAFGEQQRSLLGSTLAKKRISICQDETFHPKVCLVAIEPESNFILLEKYVEKRDADTWTEAMQEAIEDLPVEIVQSTADEGKAIRCHSERYLEATHSPDLFHIVRELCKATALPLARRVDLAAKVHATAVAAKARGIEKQDAYWRSKRGPGRPPDFAARIARAEHEEQAALEALLQANTDQKAARDAIRHISEVYHPFALDDGRPMLADEVESAIRADFDIIDQIAQRAGLSQRCRDRIDKARRVVDQMAATIALTHAHTALRLEELGLTDALYVEVATRLVPGLYLARAASRASTASVRHALTHTAETLLAPLRDPCHPFQQLDEERRDHLEAISHACAAFFQRSSSCVEGRNGRLSLFHHGFHQLSELKLSALTAVHNFHITRPDGTTAAERFFGTAHDPLFEWLVERMQWPARPAAERRKPAPAQMFRRVG